MGARVSKIIVIALLFLAVPLAARTPSEAAHGSQCKSNAGKIAGNEQTQGRSETSDGRPPLPPIGPGALEKVTDEAIGAAGYTLIKRDFLKGGTANLHLVEKNGKKYLVKDFDSYRPDNNMARWEGRMAELVRERMGIRARQAFVETKLENMGGRDVIVYEYLEGAKDLRAVIEENKLTPVQKWELAKELLTIIGEMHKQGIIHRDLKPDNLMIDAKGKLRVIDPGLGALVDELPRIDRNETEEIAVPGQGTKTYMTIGHMDGEPAKISHDLHAVNYLLTELFTGKSLTMPREVLWKDDGYGEREVFAGLRMKYYPVVKFAQEDRPGLTPQVATALHSELARSAEEKWEMLTKAKDEPLKFYTYYKSVIKRELDVDAPKVDGLVQPYVSKRVALEFLANKGLLERLPVMDLTAEQRDAVILGFFAVLRDKSPFRHRNSLAISSPFLHYDMMKEKLKVLQHKGLAESDEYYRAKLVQLEP